MKVSSVSTLIIAMLPALSAGNEVIAMAPAAEQAPIQETVVETIPENNSEIVVPDSTASEASVHAHLVGRLDRDVSGSG